MSAADKPSDRLFQIACCVLGGIQGLLGHVRAGVNGIMRSAGYFVGAILGRIYSIVERILGIINQVLSVFGGLVHCLKLPEVGIVVAISVAASCMKCIGACRLQTAIMANLFG